MKLWKIVFLAAVCFSLLFFATGCSKETHQFDAVLLEVQEGKMLLNKKSSGTELSYALINEDTKIVDSEGKKYEGEIEPGAVITVLYNDEMIRDISPTSYSEIEKIIVTGERDDSLYEKGMEEIERRESQFNAVSEQHQNSQGDS